MTSLTVLSYLIENHNYQSHNNYRIDRPRYIISAPIMPIVGVFIDALVAAICFTRLLFIGFLSY